MTPGGDLKTWVDAGVGETRAALVQDGRPVALTLARWSDEGRRARFGETYAGRVRAVDKALRGAFLDLGLAGEDGFLPLDAAGAARLGPRRAAAVAQGQLLAVEVVREGVRAKAPVLSLLETEGSGAPRRLSRPAHDRALEGAAPADRDIRAALDAAFAEALHPDAAIPGGGRLRIEPTAALVAIDVDSAGRTGARDPERLALALNIAAAGEAMRQLRLRNLGGLIAIDFVSMRAPAHRKALDQALRAAGEGDPGRPMFAPLSRFGVAELSRASPARPLHEACLDPAGAPTVETVALACLRALERESGQARGRVLSAHVAPAVADWLAASHIPWRPALEARIGSRFEIVRAAPGAPADRIDIEMR